MAEQQPPQPEPVPSPASAASQDETAPRIQIIDPQGTVARTVTLDRAGLIAGRNPENSLFLDAATISRQHFRLDWDGQQVTVTDLGSRGGTFLGEAQLIAQQAQVWNPAQSLRAGPFRLKLQIGPEEPSAAKDAIVVSLFPGQERLTITPGQSTVTNVILVNQGTQTERLLVEVDGIPAGWAQPPIEALPLEPGGHGVVPVSVLVPREFESLAGEYSVTLRAYSADRPTTAGSTQAQWLVMLFAQSRVDSRPKRLRARERATFTIGITNQGNSLAAYQLKASDPDDALTYAFPRADLLIDPGQTTNIPLTATVEKRIFSGSRRHTITVEAETPGEPTYTTNVEFVQEPFIPVGALIALPFIGLFLLLWFFGAVPFIPSSAEARELLPGYGLFAGRAVPTDTPEPTADLGQLVQDSVAAAQATVAVAQRDLDNLRATAAVAPAGTAQALQTQIAAAQGAADAARNQQSQAQTAQVQPTVPSTPRPTSTVPAGSTAAPTTQATALAFPTNPPTATPQAQTITFTKPSDTAFTTSPIALSASSSVGLTVQFESLTPDICRVSGSSVTLVTAGTCRVRAIQPGGSGVAPANPVEQAFTITKGEQLITFTKPADQVFGGAAFDLTASSNSGLVVTFASSTPDVCTVAERTVTLVGSGQCTITANQEGNDLFNPAQTVEQSFNVQKKTTSFTISLTGRPFTGEAIGLPLVSVDGSDPKPSYPTDFNTEFRGTGSTNYGPTSTPPTDAGSYVVRVTISPDSDFIASPATVEQAFNIDKANQSIDFNTPGQGVVLTFGQAFPAIGATASSGLSVGFEGLSPNVCTVNGTQVTIVAAGECQIRATQGGNNNFNAAPNNDRTFIINRANQTITFAQPADVTFGDPAVTLSASSSSGLAVAFNSQTPETCTVNGNQVTLLRAGPCTLRASQSGNNNFNPAPNVDQVLQIRAKPITFSLTQATKPFDNTPISLPTITVDGGDPKPNPPGDFAFNYVTLDGTNNPISGSDTPIPPTNAGNYRITAIISSTNFIGTPQSANFTINKASQNANIDRTPPTVVVSDTFTLRADIVDTPGNTNTPFLVLKSESAPQTCTVVSLTVVGNAVDMIVRANKRGTCEFEATAPETQNFTPNIGAESVSIGPKPITYQISDVSKIFNNLPTANPVITITSIGARPANPGGFSFSYSSSGGTSATPPTAAGTYTATVTLNDNNFSGGPVSRTFTIGQATPTITLIGVPPGPETFSNATYVISATSSSGEPVTIRTGDVNDQCSVVGGVGPAPRTIELNGAGTCTVFGSTPGNANFAPNQVSDSFEIDEQTVVYTVSDPSKPFDNNQISQPIVTITNPVVPPLPANPGDFDFEYEGRNATVYPRSTTRPTNAGEYRAIVTLDNSNFSSLPVSRDFTITPANQTITFAPIADRRFDQSPFNVSATSSSGLVVSFVSITPLVCTVPSNGQGVAFLTVGACTIQATQAGNANFTPAVPVVQSFNVTPGNQTITFAVIPDQVVTAPPFAISATASSGLPVSFVSDTPLVCSVIGVTVDPLIAGTCTVRASQAGSVLWNAAPDVTRSFNVTARPVTFTVTNPSKTFDDTPINQPTINITSPGTPPLPANPGDFVFTYSGRNATVYGPSPVRPTNAGEYTVRVTLNNPIFSGGPVDQIFTISARNINFSVSVPNKTFDGTPAGPVNFTFNPNSAPLPAVPGVFTFVYTGRNSTTYGPTSVPPTNAGDYRVTVVQGNSNFSPGTEADDFTINQANQTINFPDPPDRSLLAGAGPFPLVATASSGLTITFVRVSGTCTVAGATVTLTGVGNCQIRAEQAGNANFNAAPNVNQTFNITP
jgi:pSer/pThr/pTyr-binding forkhead associated (FHA) protein